MKTLIHTSIAGTFRAICLIFGILVFVSESTAQNNLNYSFKKIAPQAKTETIEDWESGTLTELEWETGGTQPWLVSNLTPYEGLYCASSGDINDNQNSWISLTYDVYSPENISFWYRIESEANYDYLTFYIDGSVLGEWSGNVPWSEAVFPVTAGNHTFKWEYSKDVSQSTGADAGFIDYIVFPPMEIEAFFTSDTTVICEGNAVMFFDESVGPITSWNWIFEGGTPAMSNVQNPVVGYGNAGSYDVLLQVSDGVESSEYYMANYITVGQIPAICPAPTGITYLCASWGNSSYNTVGLTGITLYDWLIEPVEAGTVSGTGKNVTVIWAEDFLGVATLKAAGVNYCGVGIYSNPLTITRYLPNVDLPGYAAVSISTPPFTLTGGTPSGGTYSGPGVSNGIFSPAVAGLGNHTITYTYTDLNLCENSDEGMIFVSQFTDISGNNFTPGVNIQPNPSNGSFVVNMNLPETSSVDLVVFNSLNEAVYSAKSIASDQKLTHDIDLSNYPAGIYYVHITSPDHQWIKKVIITK